MRELTRYVDLPHCAELRALFDVSLTPAIELQLSDAGWRDASDAFGVGREDVERQFLVSVRDRHLGDEAIFNPLRARRLKPPSGAAAADLIDDERARNGCSWCQSQDMGDSLDAFGLVRSPDGRVVARANWARSAPVSGLVHGNESMHNMLRLSLADFQTLFRTAEEYIRRSRHRAPDVHYFLCFMNGGHKSAAGVAHCHLQVLGQALRHFAYADVVRSRCPSDYWQRLQTIHTGLGLSITDGTSVAWPSICPAKERDLVIVGPGLEASSAFVFQLLQRLWDHGTNSFTLAAILSPSSVGISDDSAFRDWPPVVWRLVDRGDMRSAHGDIGASELFGSVIVSADPWDVARWLQD
jgi:hypothetical protein